MERIKIHTTKKSYMKNLEHKKKNVHTCNIKHACKLVMREFTEEKNAYGQ